MAYITGTVTGAEALLDVIRTLLTGATLGAQAWTEISYDTSDPDRHESMLIAPGLDGTKQIFVGIGAYQNKALMLRSYFGNYGASPTWNTDFDGQPDTRTANVPVSVNPITYHVVADGQHVRGVLNVGTVWTAFYLGFMLPNSNPLEHPYPLFIAGSSNGTEISATNGHRVFTCPSQNYAYVYTPLNRSIPIQNRASSNDSNLSVTGYMMPTYYGRFSWAMAAYPIEASPDGSVALIPPEIVYDDALEGGLLGKPDGFFVASGIDQNGDEFQEGTVITAGGDPYILFPNINRLAWFEWSAMRLN